MAGTGPKPLGPRRRTSASIASGDIRGGSDPAPLSSWYTLFSPVVSGGETSSTRNRIAGLAASGRGMIHPPWLTPQSPTRASSTPGSRQEPSAASASLGRIEIVNWSASSPG